MKHPAQIIFRDAPPSPAVFARIQRELARLDRHGAEIEHCRVVVAAPHPHHRHGARYRVEIELHLPRKDIVVHHVPPVRRLRQAARPGRSRTAEAGAAHKDVYLAVRDALAVADRLLEEEKRVRVAAARGRLRHGGRARSIGPSP